MGTRLTCTLLLGGGLALALALALAYPRVPESAGQASYEAYERTRQAIASESHKTPFPVMSFNVRLDCEEKDPSNHFTQRVGRLAHVFRQWAPLLVGVQEPFQGQIMDLLRQLPAEYRVIGYKRAGQTHEYAQLGHPSRLRDYQTALFYHAPALTLEHEDHIWLSDTPTLEGSRHPSSRGVRTATMGRFRLNETYFEAHGEPHPSVSHVLAFSTHLDVWSEEARRYQAHQLLRFIEAKQRLFPHDPVLLFGDFNAVPGHQTHRILTSSLHDAWDSCATKSATHDSNDNDNDNDTIDNDTIDNDTIDNDTIDNDTSHSDHSDHSDHVPCSHNEQLAITYHHYWGLFANSYAMRAAQYILHTLHGSGLFVLMDGWHGLPSYELLVHPPFPWWERLREALPTSLHRLHVDWILYRSPPGVGPMTPHLVHVVDVRHSLFSSDHFPLLALFSL